VQKDDKLSSAGGIMETAEDVDLHIEFRLGEHTASSQRSAEPSCAPL